jgi:predicted RNA-binding protein with PIN domain
MTAAAGRVTVLVDAENVRRSLWPNVQAAELVELCRAWAAANDADAVVVFDGPAPGEVVGEVERDGIVLVGTGEESADEWLERCAASLRAEARRFWLVTSDRALRAVAGDGAERLLGGGALARELAGEDGP